MYLAKFAMFAKEINHAGQVEHVESVCKFMANGNNAICPDLA